MPEVFINSIAKFLPNEAVSNDEIEDKLGYIAGKASRAKSIVLRNNKIKTRYYALDENGESTHTNAELTQKAIEILLNQANLKPEEIEVLSCGTSTPDQLLPSHTSMVQGLWGSHPLEINAAAGICTAGMNAFKYAYLNVLSGNHKLAIATGSERVSSWLKSEKYTSEYEKLQALEKNPMIGFEKDFLRWMLSDGAGAFLLSNQPNANSHSLKIHWIEGQSYAHELETCMYAGATKKDGVMKFWSDMPQQEWLNESVFSIKQDIKLLESHIIQKGVQSTQYVLAKHNLHIDEIDYYLPHISSFVFKEKLYQAFKNENMEIPEEKWFINLDRVGNVGAASIYIQLEELFNQTTLEKGKKILLSVPESGRFNYVYALLEVC